MRIWLFLSLRLPTSTRTASRSRRPSGCPVTFAVALFRGEPLQRLGRAVTVVLTCALRHRGPRRRSIVTRRRQALRRLSYPSCSSEAQPYVATSILASETSEVSLRDRKRRAIHPPTFLALILYPHLHFLHLQTTHA